MFFLPLPKEQNAGVETWREFLQQISCGDETIAEFLQQFAEMAPIGKVYEERLLIAIGSGGNGRSTFSMLSKMSLVTTQERSAQN